MANSFEEFKEVGDAESVPNPFDEFERFDDSPGAMAFVNKAIAETLGAPMDIYSAAIQPKEIGTIKTPDICGKDLFLGSKSIKNAMEFYGMRLPEEGAGPSTLPEYIGAGVGEVSSLILPGGIGLKALAKSRGITTTAGRIASSIYKSMVKHPALSMISELGGGAGVGTGRKIAEEQFPESPMARTAVELAGGVVGGMGPSLVLHLPSMVAIRSGKNLLKRMTMPFTKPGSQYRSGKFAKGLVADPETTIREITKETISDLPPAVASGERKLQGLYKGLVALDPVSDAASIEKISKAVVTLENEMRKLGYGAPELLAEITQKRVAAIELKMDRRVMSAMDNAQSKLDTMPVATRQTEESRIVRDELEKVARQVNDDVRKLWADVDKNLSVGVDNTRSTYTTLLDDISKAERVDIPAPLKNSFIVAEKDPGTTTIKEMQGLRSKLLEVSRIARKDSKWNKARIADKMADAILDDLEASGVSESLKAALAGTRNYKTLFESGIVGKLRGFDKTGAPAIDPSLTLEISLGREGARGAVDINKVVITPEAQVATKRYLTRSYTDYALDDTGSINPAKSARWVKNNEDILDQFPDLRTQMLDAGETQDLATRTKAVMETRKKAIQNPNISVAARVVNAVGLNTEIGSILSSDNSVRMIDDLVRKASKDTSGNALSGLRAGFVNHILERSARGSFNELGEQTLSGRAMLAFVNKNETSLKRVFTPESIKRMRQIGAELARIETVDLLKPGKPDIKLEDAASNMIQLISRVGGAQIGRIVARVTGGGTVQTPGIFSDKFRALTLGLNFNRANEMIIDAVVSDSPDMLKALLLPLNKPTTQMQNLFVLNKQMNLWLAGVGSRVLEDVIKEKTEDQEISGFSERTNVAPEDVLGE